jgi:hypothetical protein
VQKSLALLPSISASLTYDVTKQTGSTPVRLTYRRGGKQQEIF